MSLIKVDCPIDGCTYSTGDVPESVCVALINAPALQHSNLAQQSSHGSGPKLVRPMVSMGIAMGIGVEHV